jgi:predicted ATP-dependent Lon-type protease
MDYIHNDSQYDKKMQKIVNGGINGIIQLYKWKYCDKTHPENNNIRTIKDCLDDADLEIFNGRRWTKINRDEAIDMMLQRIADDIDNFLGYAIEHMIKIKLNSFIENVAKPLGFDMLNVDVDDVDVVDDTVKEDIRSKLYALISKQ